MKEKEKIYKKLDKMKDYVEFLKDFKEINENKLEEDYKLKSAIERNFQLAIEAVLDIGEIIISMEDFKKPEKYKDIILILGKNKVLPKKFAKKFAPAAGFRNILVHMYEIVDTKELCNHLKKLEDFSKFTEYIAKYLKKKQ